MMQNEFNKSVKGPSLHEVQIMMKLVKFLSEDDGNLRKLENLFAEAEKKEIDTSMAAETMKVEDAALVNLLLSVGIVDPEFKGKSGVIVQLKKLEEIKRIYQTPMDSFLPAMQVVQDIAGGGPNTPRC